MKSILLFLFLFFITQFSYGIPVGYRELIQLDQAVEFYNREVSKGIDPLLAVHDVSFFGHKILLKNQLALVNEVAPLNLISPHGVAVSQVITHHEFGVKKDQKISLLTRGIYLDEIEKAVGLWIKHKIAVVNLSIRMRTPEIMEAINSYIDQGGIAIVSAGNDGERLGVDLPDYYHDFKGLVIGACDENGIMTSFSQYGSKVILAPGELDSIPVERLSWNIAPRTEPNKMDSNLKVQNYLFGQTSASTPIVSGIVLMAKKLNPNLTQKDINQMIRASAFEIDGKLVINAYEFLKLSNEFQK